MCGIVGAVTRRNVSPLLIEGLRRLEYRGYDSAGIAVLTKKSDLNTAKLAGKVENLAAYLDRNPLIGDTGIAHTRWATHGRPSEVNAHPHVYQEQIAIVHNGIIENYQSIRSQLIDVGYTFISETDSEVIVNKIHYFLSEGLNPLDAVIKTTQLLEGTYAIGIIFENDPNRIIAARHGSPLIIGIGAEEYYIASDIFALLPLTKKYIILEDGDIADVSLDNGLRIIDDQNTEITRPVVESSNQHEESGKTGFRHFMHKEIHEQPSAIFNTLAAYVRSDEIKENIFGVDAGDVFHKTQAVQIVACGTSYHAGLVARYWFESIVGIPCSVDIASEYRYFDTHIAPGTLFIAISQSGETADTLAAIKKAKTREYLASLSISNVMDSSMARESDFEILTRAGLEIGVASTKAFTTQLTVLMLIVLELANRKLSDNRGVQLIFNHLQTLPGRISNVLELEPMIAKLAEQFVNKEHALYLGRGNMLPVAMEGALKLKEISYIHAEAYAAGELKHGPLALVDENMPVIAVAPNNDLLKKLISNLQEVHARGGELYVFADSDIALDSIDEIHKIRIPAVDHEISPILYTVPLQLLAYHVAVLKGADVDQPRNLAKSVTVE